MNGPQLMLFSMVFVCVVIIGVRYSIIRRMQRVTEVLDKETAQIVASTGIINTIIRLGRLLDGDIDNTTFAVLSSELCTHINNYSGDIQREFTNLYTKTTLINVLGIYDDGIACMRDHDYDILNKIREKL